MGFQSSWTEGHKDEVEGLTITESWIKESMTMDKSVALGLDANLPLGSWFIGCYCENDDIWNAVKEGKYHGFSIEAIVGVEEFESEIGINKDRDMIETDEMFWDKLKGLLKEMFTKNKEADIEPVNIEDLEAQTEPQPTEPTEPTVEEPTQEPLVEEPQPTEEPKPQDNSHLEELINSLRSEIEALKESNTGLQDKIKEMSKQPSAAPINTNAKNGGNGGDSYAQWRETMRRLM